jgi:DNA-binding transcriptional LysR family regulator
MNIDTIHTFLTLVEHKNFTKAADSLCISQSALSHRVHLLEKEIGDVLIVRSRGKRDFYLTEAGTAFIPLAEEWIAIEKDMEHFKHGKRVHTLIVSNVETLTQVFGSLYRKFTVSFKDRYAFLFHTYAYPSFYIINEVDNQNIDIGFVVRQRMNRNLKIEPVFAEKHYLLGALGSDKKIIDPRTLDPRKELLTDWSSSYLPWHNWYFGSDNVPFAVVDTATSAIEFLAEGTWCIVPKCSISFLQANCALRGTKLQVYEIPNPPPDRICYKVTHRFPIADRLERIRFFEEQLQIYLKENNLHL